MNGKISNWGNLEIERAGKLKTQTCIYDKLFTNEDSISCGDHCPLFSEPEEWDVKDFKLKRTIITICQDRELIFDKFTDERPKT